MEMETNMKMYTVTQAAERLGLTAPAVYAAIRRGRIKARRIGSIYLISGDEIERYAETCKGKVGRPSRTRRKSLR